jgi:hypothetical protein
MTISVVPALGSVSIGATLASQPVVMLTLAAEGYGATPILVPQSVGEIVARLGGQLATEHVETGTSTVVITVPRVVRLVAVPPQRGVLPFEPKASNL